ncbi:MAG: M28 family peptidase [Meiothermus sp.]|nr:M28 family peptidase [Meiothermus sp.]
MLEQVSLETPWELVERFSTMKREHPDDVRAAAKEIVKRLEQIGVPYQWHEPSLFLSLPGKARVEQGGRSFRAKPMAMSQPAQGLTAPLGYAPSAYAKGANELFTRMMPVADSEIRGKIVVTEGYGMPGKVAELEARGAVGMIAVNPGQNAHWGICTTIWGVPDLHDLPRKPGIPVMAVNHPDGLELIAAAQRGESAALFADVAEGWWPSPVPVVEIPGTEEPDKFVLLHGHYDSWDVGVGDNAVGNATLLEIARVLWHNRQHLKRSVRIAWWPGHSTGRYAGSTWFADAFAIDLYENCIAQVNCDSPGCRWATSYHDISWMPETEAFAKQVIFDVTGLASQGERPHQAGDYSFNNIGISSYFMLLSTMPEDLRQEKGYYAVGGCGGNIAWHTEDDTIEIADRDILLKDIKIYLLAVLRNANATIAPFDFKYTLHDFRQTLQQYQAAAGEHFSFAPSRDALGQFEAALHRFAKHCESLAGLGVQNPKVKAANHAIRRLARLLVPVNFTRETGFFHDPAESIPPLPDLAPALGLAQADGWQRGFIQTHLTRGQNRLVAALRDAWAVLESAMQ